MDIVLQQIVNAISLGGIYALLALGLAVVFSIVSLINFAHGELMTVAGYGMFFAAAVSLPFPFAVAAAVVFAVIAALLTERFAFRPMRKADATGLLLTSFAVSAILRVIFQNGISARPKPVPLPSGFAGVVDLGFLHVGIVPLLSIAMTAVSLIALTLFLNRTTLGKAMRAAAEDFQVLRLMGIRANRVIAVAFAVSGALAGIAAVLWIAQRGSVDPLMGFVPVLKAFVAAVIGGLGSLSGAVAGGFALGILEVLFQAFLPDAALPFRDAYVLGFVILILIWRPDGLIPAPVARRKLMATANSIYARDGQVIAGLQKLRFFPLALEGGHGAHVIDEAGRSLLDLSGAWGAASLGYGHPALADAVCAAVRNPAGASILSATHRGAVDLAQQILATLPELDDHKVWFGHSGSDANETAFRAIAAATRRPRVIAFRGAYHGGTAGSMAISGHAAQSHAARAEGLTLIPYPNPYRGENGAATLDHLAALFATTLPPQEVGALFIEPIQSDGGFIVPPPGFLKRLAEMCRSHGILIVSDEVKVGLARTGHMHCFRHEDFTPDFVCLGKGLGGGLAISALVGPRSVMDHATAFAMQTLHGNPVSVAAARVLDTIASAGLAENASTVGAALLEGLTALKARHAAIGDVRGRGLAIGVELVSDANARTPSKMLAAKTVFRAFELGLVLYYVGLNSNVLELTPPLILTRDEAEQAISILDRALADVEQGHVSDDAVRDFAGW